MEYAPVLAAAVSAAGAPGGVVSAGVVALATGEVALTLPAASTALTR